MHERGCRKSQEGCGPGRCPGLSTRCCVLAHIPAAGTCEKVASDLGFVGYFCPVPRFQPSLKTGNSWLSRNAAEKQ